jgi:MSHA pilin protein MshC
MTASRGYSLMEVITVIVIAGILAAIVMPQFNQPQVDASWYYEKVKAAVRYAQRQAVAQRRTVYVVVSASSVQLCYDAGCTSALNDFATGAAYVASAPSGVSLTPVTFSFNGLGQPSAGTTFSVGTLPVTVIAETGYVP